LNAEIKAYAGSLYEKASMESVKQLQEERATYLAKIAQRSTGLLPLGGSEIRAIVDQHVRHIERCMSARLESYRQAFTEADQTPTDDDFNTILRDAQGTREQQAKHSAAAVRSFIASRGVLAQSELERRRSPLVSIPPFGAGIFKALGSFDPMRIWEAA
jgi:hypothetical protein